MRFSVTTVFLALAAIGSAAPTSTDEATKKLCKKSYFTGFEHIAAGPIDVFNGVPTPFHALAFPGFTVVDQGLIGNVHPQSPTNAVAFGVVNNLLRGTPTISTSYPSSKARFFSLHELYMSCIVVDPAGVFLATSCSVQATGTKASGKKVYATLNFDAALVNLPVVSPKINQQKQTLPTSFNHLKNITFEVTTASLLPLTAEVFMDSFKYDVYSKC